MTPQQVEATSKLLRVFFEQTDNEIVVNGSEYVIIHTSFSLAHLAEFLCLNSAGVHDA